MHPRATPQSRVGNCEAGADRQYVELVDRVAADAPIRELRFV